MANIRAFDIETYIKALIQEELETKIDRHRSDERMPNADGIGKNKGSELKRPSLQTEGEKGLSNE